MELGVGFFIRYPDVKEFFKDVKSFFKRKKYRTNENPDKCDRCKEFEFCVPAFQSIQSVSCMLLEFL